MALNGMTSLYISTSSPVLPLRGLELQAHTAAFEEEGGRRDSSVASAQTTASFLLGPEALCVGEPPAPAPGGNEQLSCWGFRENRAIREGLYL